MENESLRYDNRDWIPREQTPTAELQQAGMLSGITGMEVMGIPVGAAVVGGAGAAIVAALQERFLPGVTGMMGKLIAAWATLQFGQGIIGREGAKYAALFLAWDALKDTVEPLVSGLTRPFAGAQPFRQDAFRQDYAPITELSALEQWLNQ